jgi:putative phosphoesterase
MKIAVLSDTHIPYNAPSLSQAVSDALKGADMIIHAGDLADMQFLNKLKQLCPVVKAVRGNMDSEELKKILPEKEILKISGFKLGLIHGWGAPKALVEAVGGAFKDDEVDMIIFGHSHSPMNEERDGIIYFNPGSPTDTVYAPYNSYGWLDVGETISARIIKI